MSDRLYLNDDNENKCFSQFNNSYYINEYEKINKQKNLYSKNDLVGGRVNTNISQKIIENENTIGYQRNKEFDQEKFNQSKPKDKSELNVLKSNIEDFPSISSLNFGSQNLSDEYNFFGKNNDDSSLSNYMKDLENQNDKKEKNCLFDVQNTVDNETSLNTQEISGLEKKTINLISIDSIGQNNSSKLPKSRKENNNNNTFSKLKGKISQQKDDSFLIKPDEDNYNKNINLNTSVLENFWTLNENNICNSQSKPEVPYFNNNELPFQLDCLKNSSLGLNKKFSDLSKENLEVSGGLYKPFVNPESNKLLGNKRNKPNKESKKIFEIKKSRNKIEKKEQLNDLDNFDNINEINSNGSEDYLNNTEIFPIIQELGTNKKGNENKINIDNDFNVDIPLRENNAITSIKHYLFKMFIDEINEKIAVKDKTKQLYVTKFAKSINRNKNLESYRQKWKDILLINYKDEKINENNLENNRETIKHIYDNKENFEDAYNLLEMPFDKYYNNFLNNNLEEFISKQREKQLADFKQKKYKMIIEKLIQDNNWDELNIIKVNFISFISLNKEGEKKIKTKPLSEEDFFHCYSYTIYKPEKFQNYVKKIDKSLNFDFEYEKEIIERNMCLLKNTAKRYENWFSEKTPRKIKKKFFKVKSSFKNS